MRDAAVSIGAVAVQVMGGKRGIAAEFCVKGGPMRTICVLGSGISIILLPSSLLWSPCDDRGGAVVSACLFYMGMLIAGSLCRLQDLLLGSYMERILLKTVLPYALRRQVVERQQHCELILNVFWNGVDCKSVSLLELE